ncbi:unnamed protein product [Colias eurytheme]|nr:unnamed protein product [Colias eurytheme]
MRTIYSYWAISYPVIILEMAADVIDDIKIDLADRIITSTDSRRIDELNKLLHLQQNQPITFSLWRAIPLNARLPLGFVSLIANYLVCLLQFTHFQAP